MIRDLQKEVPDPTRNYVTWDQDVLDRAAMMERDGETLGMNAPTAAAPGAAMMGDENTGDEQPLRSFRQKSRPTNAGPSVGGGEIRRFRTKQIADETSGVQ